jgi:tetratricopeptide (TPR) repeat protein
MMLHPEHRLVVQMLRFFPKEGFDKQAADEAIARASTPAALDALAYVEMTFGRWDRAARLWGRAAALEPTKAMHHYNFAMAQYRACDCTPDAAKRALDECRIAAALDPNFAEAQIEVAGFLVDFGRFDEAFTIYAETKKQAPTSLRLEFDWAHALMELGRDLEAAQHYEAATHLEPNYVDAWSNLCFVLNRAGRKREAREAAKRAEFLGHAAARMALDAESSASRSRRGA